MNKKRTKQKTILNIPSRIPINQSKHNKQNKHYKSANNTDSTSEEYTNTTVTSTVGYTHYKK